MASFKDLPCEMVGEILRKLNHLRDLTSMVLTCRHVYNSFKEFRKADCVEALILRRQITPALVPYAVALVKASHLPLPWEHGSITSLLDKLYRQPATLAKRLATLPTPFLRQMSDTHDAIHASATDFASGALERMLPQSASTRGTLSPTEYFRFCRAFYRVDLFYAIFREEIIDEKLNDWFLRRHPPWENEQLGCVYDYLEAKFAEASFEVFAHDVYFGWDAVDYLTRGAGNKWTQSWISRGVRFVYRLTIADSYDVKNCMLQSGLNATKHGVNLPLVLDLVNKNAGAGNAEDYTEEELHSIATRDSGQPKDDTDRGPYEAWRIGNEGQSLEFSVMSMYTASFRERAYVLWDLERVEQLRDEFAWTRRQFCGMPTDEEFQKMTESIKERALIWKHGGRGYWSKGDLSRVVWPDE